MDETVYKSNSFKSREKRKQEEEIPEKKVEKVVSGAVKTKKKTEMQQFADSFINEDLPSVKSFILLDVLIPAAKKALYDIWTTSADILIYKGEGGHSKRGSTAGRVSYGSYYGSSRDRRPSREPNSTRAKVRYSYNDIVLESRVEAEEVLDRMDELVERYGMASVGDLYDLVGITGDYTDQKYGWYDTSKASFARTPDGYKLKFPRAVAFD